VKLSKLLGTILLAAMLVFPSSMVKAMSLQSSTVTLENISFSTWLWNTSEIVIDSDKIIDFLVEKNVKVLYLQVDYNLDYRYYEAFIGKASGKGIAVEALDGSPNWVSANGITCQNKFFEWLDSYQKAAAPGQQFKGVHFDVEPYLNSEYKRNPDKVLNQYQDFILRSKAECLNHGLNFGMDIPFWFNEVKYSTTHGTGNLGEWVIENLEAVTIMAYRDSAYGIINVAAAEMAMCEQNGIEARIAVETGNVRSTRYVTFYQEGQAVMFQQLAHVYGQYSENKAFSGFAVHYLDSWMTIKK
jgi:hypothetical protein